MVYVAHAATWYLADDRANRGHAHCCLRSTTTGGYPPRGDPQQDSKMKKICPITFVILWVFCYRVLWDGDQASTYMFSFFLHIILVANISDILKTYNPWCTSVPVNPSLFFASILFLSLPTSYLLSNVLETRLNTLVEEREKLPVRAINIPIGWRKYFT